jgi:hypothetical protein
VTALIGQMKVKDSNLFLLPGNPHILHIATISYGLREFIVMLDHTTQNMYIEEIVLESTDFSNDVWANMKFIDDDELAFDLAKFADDLKLIDMKRIQNYLVELKDRIWKKEKIL